MLFPPRIIAVQQLAAAQRSPGTRSASLSRLFLWLLLRFGPGTEISGEVGVVRHLQALRPDRRILIGRAPMRPAIAVAKAASRESVGWLALPTLHSLLDAILRRVAQRRT